MSKLTKQQKDLFERLVRETVVGIVSQVTGEQTDGRLPAVADIILKESLAVGNLDHVVDAVAESLLAKVDFKTLKKVDTFMKSDDYIKVMLAMQEVVFAEHREDFMNLVAAVTEVSEKAIKSVAEEQASEVEALVEESAI